MKHGWQLGLQGTKGFWEEHCDCSCPKGCEGNDDEVDTV